MLEIAMLVGGPGSSVTGQRGKLDEGKEREERTEGQITTTGAF